MTERHTIESLAETFLIHAKEAEGNFKKSVKQYKETHPNEELPEHMKTNFNIASALAVMCEEILKLKERAAYEDA